jgi:hypothetical protein
MKEVKMCVYCRVEPIKPTGTKYCSYLCLNRSKNQWGENNPDWKGGKVKNSGLHAYMQTTYGKGERCEQCDTEGKYYIGKVYKRWSIEWANITGVYDRERKNWKQLCKKCHIKHDTQKRKETKQTTQTWKLK